jgi:hypothetical protein
MGDHQVPDSFGKCGSPGSDGVLSGERTDQGAPLGVGEAHIDTVISGIRHRGSATLAH